MAKHPRFGLPTRATSPDAKPTSWPCGTAPASVRPTTGSLLELANLRTAFRWAADHGDLDVAATIATYAGLLGATVQSLEPIAWAEELIEPARVADHPRLRIPVRDCVAVLHDRTDRGGCPLLRRRPDRSRQEPRGAAVRHRRLAWSCIR